MKINKKLIERGKMGNDRTIINLDSLLILEEEFPVYLNNENLDKDPIGTAKVYRSESDGWLHADIDLPSNKAYLKLYPSIAVSIQIPDQTSYYRGNLRTVNDALLIGIILSQGKNVDNKITQLGKRLEINGIN